MLAIKRKRKAGPPAFSAQKEMIKCEISNNGYLGLSCFYLPYPSHSPSDKRLLANNPLLVLLGGTYFIITQQILTRHCYSTPVQALFGNSQVTVISRPGRIRR